MTACADFYRQGPGCQANPENQAPAGEGEGGTGRDGKAGRKKSLIVRPHPLPTPCHLHSSHILSFSLSHLMDQRADFWIEKRGIYSDLYKDPEDSGSVLEKQELWSLAGLALNLGPDFISFLILRLSG